MSQSAHNNYKYHLKMMLNKLRKLRAEKKGDTRIYLSLDTTETNILDILIHQEFMAASRTLLNYD